MMSENVFYAVPSIAGKVSREIETNSFGGDVVEPMMIVNFSQSSQVHAPVITEIDLSSAKDTQGNPGPKRAITAMVFLALGRDCTAYEIYCMMQDIRALCFQVVIISPVYI